ncbi:sensor histidine kinase [Hyalangium versicolor]|uniref:sensor histidine kinase n=1 Tax=Hyalangium versicolor TaxID=2861190 RepID=UPI001CCA9D09|nr:HAMP domain-containing sensor histidine kinase [Hyalangium versicolor]
MKLRLRLALTAAAVTVPLIAVLGFLQQSLRSRSQEEVLEAATLAQMQAGERERCEAAPESWMLKGGLRLQGGPSSKGGRGEPPPKERFELFGPPGPPPGDEDRGPPPGPPPDRDRKSLGRGPGSVQLFPYDSQLVSRNPQAPVLDEQLRAEARLGEGRVSRQWRGEGQRFHEVLVRMPWDSGPCAYILARRQEPSGPPFGFLPPLDLWGFPTLIVLATVVVVLGPVVGRIRRLTEEVRTSASSHYQQPISVQGSDEIGELARAFQEARTEIQNQMAQQEAREQALRDFLANTTHDVMTPLTVLQGHLSAMEQRAGRGEPLEPGLVASAMSEAHYMASLVHNLSAAARLEAGTPATQRVAVDLNALVGRVVGRHQPIARQQQISLESGVPGMPTWVLGDVTLIEQAVSNIVFNGIRYGREGGHVAVVLETTRQGRFHLRVIDDGPGIPEEERSRLLERSFRGNAARTRAPQGQGLGLHITHNVAQVHGWTLTLEPSEYGGLEVGLAGDVLMESPAIG